MGDELLCIIKADKEFIVLLLCLLYSFELVLVFRLVVVVEEVYDEIS